MALLSTKFNQQLIYLQHYHQIGRLPTISGTVVTSPYVSKIHCLLEYNEGVWWLKDVSSNGTWLNDVLLPTNQAQPLKIGDTIVLAQQAQLAFDVIDLQPPVAALVPENFISQEQLQPLSNYSLLPSAEHPEFILSKCGASDDWTLADLEENIIQSEIRHGSVIDLAGYSYRLHDSQALANTSYISKTIDPLERCQFVFRISLDEENTNLELKTDTDSIDLQERAHHYLIANLARYKLRDKQSGLSERDCGWVDTEQFAKDLGVDIKHLNIQIHRARKQLSVAAENLIDPNVLIERRRCKLRFSAKRFEIYKGEHLEAKYYS